MPGTTTRRTTGRTKMLPYRESLSFAESQRLHPTQDWTNFCQMFSRMCVGADSWAPSARLAFNAIPYDHRHSGKPPAGSLAYFGYSDVGFGHVVWIKDNAGNCYSNDIKRKGKIDIVKYDVFPEVWGLPYRGWIDWTPSGSIKLYAPDKPSRHLLHLLHVTNKHGGVGLSAHQKHQVNRWLKDGVEIP